jgi:hypothetical protein
MLDYSTNYHPFSIIFALVEISCTCTVRLKQRSQIFGLSQGRLTGANALALVQRLRIAHLQRLRTQCNVAQHLVAVQLTRACCERTKAHFLCTENSHQAEATTLF